MENSEATLVHNFSQDATKNIDSNDWYEWCLILQKLKLLKVKVMLKYNNSIDICNYATIYLLTILYKGAPFVPISNILYVKDYKRIQMEKIRVIINERLKKTSSLATKRNRKWVHLLENIIKSIIICYLFQIYDSTCYIHPWKR